MKDKLVIIGCGGHARSAADVYLLNNPDAEIIFIDENAQDEEKILGFPVFKNYNITTESVFIAIGDNQKRLEVSKKHSNLCSIISKTAYIGREVKIGNGVLIAHNTHIGVGTKIYDNAIINTSASIDHNCVIGTNSHIAPNSTICGWVAIGKNVFVGAGSTVIDKLAICDNTIIGAGSVIYKNIDTAGTYVGKEGQKIR